ncbi:hypothetical protein TNCV_1387701 [Trichonephila clavipes]|nr:hypothetical protein TNCV_1387701 [Trichonephila clavipes]
MTGTLPPLLDSVLGGGMPGSSFSRAYVSEYAVSILRSGDLLAETNSVKQTVFLTNQNISRFSSVSISPHKSLNTSRTVISEPDLLTSLIWKSLINFLIRVSKELLLKRDATITLTIHLTLTFNRKKLPGRFNTSTVPTFRILHAALSARDARKLIAPQISQTYTLAAKAFTTSTTQTDETITKLVYSPLKLLPLLISVSKPAMSSIIPTVAKSSTSLMHIYLLPSTSSVVVTTSSEFQAHIPLIDTTPATSRSLCTSVASSFSNKALSSSTGSIFSPLPAETSPVLETTTTI